MLDLCWIRWVPNFRPKIQRTKTMGRRANFPADEKWKNTRNHKIRQANAENMVTNACRKKSLEQIGRSFPCIDYVLGLNYAVPGLKWRWCWWSKTNKINNRMMPYTLYGRIKKHEFTGISAVLPVLISCGRIARICAILPQVEAFPSPRKNKCGKTGC